MPLDVTVGGAAANSYASIAEADGFAASDLGRFAEAWTKATTEQKEAALRRAAQEIDAFVGIRPEEAYYFGVQTLVFPRVGDLDLVGTVIIPTRVKRAQYLQAAYLVAAADQIDDAALRRSKGFSSYVNPDGTGGTLATESSYGRLHPDVEVILGQIDTGAVIGTIVPT
jgi:hypothetical protein